MSDEEDDDDERANDDEAAEADDDEAAEADDATGEGDGRTDEDDERSPEGGVDERDGRTDEEATGRDGTGGGRAREADPESEGQRVPTSETGEGDPLTTGEDARGVEANADVEAAGSGPEGESVDDVERTDREGSGGATVAPEDVQEAIEAKERQRENGAPGSEAVEAASEDGATESVTDATDQPRTATGEANEGVTVSAAVVTVSRERTHDDDPGGAAIETALEENGHEVVAREILRPTYDTVQQSLDALVSRDDVDTVVTNGGTGVTGQDVTVEAVHPLIEKALPGFGEVFRSLYYDEVGTDVVTSRAMAGIADSTPVFCLPGDPTATRLGVGEVVVDQAPRIVAACDDGPSDR